MRRLPSTMQPLSKLSAVILSILIFSTLSLAAVADRISGPIVPGQFIKVSAGVPRKAQPQFDQGAVDPGLKLSYMTLLTVPSASQRKAINQLLAQQQDPRSALYHKWLTPEQYAERFGLSQNDVNKIVAWLQSQGFTVHNVARSRNDFVFSGTVAQIENAFQPRLHNFNIDGEKHFANTTPPSIPAALSSIVTGIRGLNDFRPKPFLERRKPDYSFPLGGNQYALFLAPGDITTIYDIGALYAAGIDGTGQKLAVMGRTDVYLADLNDFRSAFGLTPINCTPDANGLITTACNTTNFQYVLNGPDPGVNFVGDDLPEADLDLEWSGATAYNAQIIYVNSGGTAGDVFDAYYYTIQNNLAPVITMSYGFCEFDEAQSGFKDSDEAELKQANLQGQTFMNSSGDDGAATCDFTPPNANPPFSAAVGGLAVSYPASSPEVTGVGGTMIPLGEYNATYWTASNGSDGGSALCPVGEGLGPCIPENGWNDDAEIGAFCAANPSSSNCHPTHGVAITNAQTAQEDFWIASSGGGFSNCTVVDVNNLCIVDPDSGQLGFAQPAWQTVTVPGQAAARFVPDVSLLASANFPGYIFCSAVDEFVGGTDTTSSCAGGINNSITTYSSIVGGTSVSSPVFAGIVALLNQYAVQNGFQGAPGLGNINPSLYQIATYNPSAFHPVTAGLNAPGSNIVYCQTGEPTGQPSALLCPSTGKMGFLAANADTVTGYNLVTGLGSVDVGNLATAWGEVLTATTTSLARSAATIVEGQTETFTITVTPSSASGIVTLKNTNGGTTTTLGTATITGGTGTFTTAATGSTALPVGTNSIKGYYVGVNAPSTSSAVTVTVTAASVSLSDPVSSGPVLSGQSATYTFTATPTGNPTFTADVALACSGLPDATVTCTFNTGQADPSKILAGSGATNVTLTIATTGPNTGCISCSRRAENRRSPWLPLALPLAGIVVAGFAGRKLSRHSAIAGLCVSLALLGLLVACGGSSTPPVNIVVSQGTPSSVFPNNTGWSPVQTAQFTATVTNTTNTAVTWAVTTPNGGTIDANGLYTAPTVAAGLPTSVTIKATSAADTSKSASATETLKAATIPGTYTVTVTATEFSPVSKQVTLTVQ